jgi:hypothetical protein
MKRASVLVLAFLPGVASAPAFAEEPASAEPRAASRAPAPDLRAEARALAQRGDTQFEAGRCDKAIPLWREAYVRFHAPTILLRIGRCQSLLGKVVEAAATLSDITREPIDPAEPWPFGEARREAARDLASLRSRIATVKISLQRLKGVTSVPKIEIDQDSFSGEEAVVAVDPGRHVLRVRATEVLWERAVTLDDGEVQSYRLSLWSESTPPLPRPQQQVGLAIGGVGIASLAVGIGFAASAFATSRHLASVCDQDRKQCPEGEQGAIDRLGTSSRVADITLASGAALLATGALVLIAEPRPREAPPRIRVSASAWTPVVDSANSSSPGVGVWIAGAY